MKDASGAFSGGTVASGRAMEELVSAEEQQHWASDQYYLVTDKTKCVPKCSPHYELCLVYAYVSGTCAC
jgi:hypothetical protein